MVPLHVLAPEAVQQGCLVQWCVASNSVTECSCYLLPGMLPKQLPPGSLQACQSALEMCDVATPAEVCVLLLGACPGHGRVQILSVMVPQRQQSAAVLLPF